MSLLTFLMFFRRWFVIPALGIFISGCNNVGMSHYHNTLTTTSSHYCDIKKWTKNSSWYLLHNDRTLIVTVCAKKSFSCVLVLSCSVCVLFSICFTLLIDLYQQVKCLSRMMGTRGLMATVVPTSFRLHSYSREKLHFLPRRPIVWNSHMSMTTRRRFCQFRNLMSWWALIFCSKLFHFGSYNMLKRSLSLQGCSAGEDAHNRKEFLRSRQRRIDRGVRQGEPAGQRQAGGAAAATTASQPGTPHRQTRVTQQQLRQDQTCNLWRDLSIPSARIWVFLCRTLCPVKVALLTFFL